MRQAARLLLSSVLLLCALPAANASATSTGPAPCNPSTGVCDSQGIRYRPASTGGGSDNGTRAYLAGTGHTNSTGGIAATVAIFQNTGASNPGYIQGGEFSQSSDWSSDCVSGAATDVFLEYFVSGSSIGHCPYHHGITAFGNGGLFTVAEAANGWEFFWNGNGVWTQSGSLGFMDGWSMAFAEAFVNPNKTGPSYAMTWGPNGQISWQFKTSSKPYTTIDTSDRWANLDSDKVTDSDGDWNLGGTPSPFNINWTGW